MQPAIPRDALPLGAARLVRPADIRRYGFDDFLQRPWGTPRFRLESREHSQAGMPLPVVPIEAVAPGDTQVWAAREPLKTDSPVLPLDALADFPSVESVIASTPVRASRSLPGIRELLVIGHDMAPDPATLDNLSALESLYFPRRLSAARVDLERLPAHCMRHLAISHWMARSLEPLARMPGLRQLEVQFFRESLEAVARMNGLTFLSVLGPAKAWASLRECAQLEEASLIDVQLANMKRWNTWTRLRHLCLGGRGLQSVAGIEACTALESLVLLNLRTADLSAVRDLSRLTELRVRMPDRALDLASIAAVPALRRFELEEAVVTDRDVFRLPTLAPLSAASNLEELVLLGTRIEDGDLLPLAGLERLRQVRLGCDIGCDVEKLRAARPDLTIHYTPPKPSTTPSELVGQVSIHPPVKGVAQWWIFDSFADALRVSTNYAAEKRIRSEIRKADPALLKRVEWDTEAGAVGIYTNAEADIRAVAEILNRLIAEYERMPS